MSKKRPSIKKVSRDTYTLRANRNLLKSLRFMLGNLNQEAAMSMCQNDIAKVKGIETLFFALSDADLRTPEETQAGAPLFMTEEGIADRLRTAH